MRPDVKHRWPGRAARCGAVLLGVLCVLSTVVLGEQTPRVGTLRIEGAGIERLVLQNSAGRRYVFYYREPNLVLPADVYRLEEVILPGEYSGRWPWQEAATRVVKIEPDRVVNITLGAPLRQTVRVERWGASLVLNYHVLGRGGESYSITQRQAARPPTFVIYQGESELATGVFEPG